MKKIVLTFGLIAGAIVSAVMFAAMPLYKNKIITFENGEYVGYTSMVIALSMVFFGIKSYRENNLGGSITFGTGFKVGLLITVVASLCYAIGWEFYFNIFAPDFMDEYATFAIQKAKSSGATEVKVQELITKMDEAREMYKNPFIRFGMTLMEIFPVGLLISLVSAGLLRKKNFLPTQTV